MLLAGAERSALREVAEQLSAWADGVWHCELTWVEDGSRHCQRHWPDLLAIHCAGVTAARLREVVRWFHAAAGVPVLVLTEPDQVEHRLVAVSTHADDDAVLPLDSRELRARADRLAERREAARRRQLGDLVLDGHTRDVARRGERITLTPSEFRVVARLAASANEAVSMAELIAAIGHGASSRSVQTHVHALRHKLERAGPPLIHTVAGVGYVLRPVPSVDIHRRVALVQRREELVKQREEAVALRAELLDRFERTARSGARPDRA